VNRVDAFQYTAAESTSARKRRAVDSFAVTIASLCADPCSATCDIAASTPSTIRTLIT
jgi:hypothetical protein